jgi:hypothetical protein
MTEYDKEILLTAARLLGAFRAPAKRRIRRELIKSTQTETPDE